MDQETGSKIRKARKESRVEASRKKGAHDQALKLYLEAEGKITNTALASTVGVSTNSIANWKRVEQWAAKLVESKKEPLPPATPSEVPVTTSPETIAWEEPVTTPQMEVTDETEELEIDVDKLACPDHINRMNKRIDDLLGQDYLSPTDLRNLGGGKRSSARRCECLY